jgi:hypothetical protein
MSTVTELAFAQLTATETITVELIEADQTPAVIIVRWPSKPSVFHPRRFPGVADTATRTLLALLYGWQRSRDSAVCEAPHGIERCRRGVLNNDRTTVAGISATGGAAFRHPDRRPTEPRTPMTQYPGPPMQPPGPPMQPPGDAPMPPPGMPQAQVQPRPIVPPKKKRFGWAPLAAIIGLAVGGALGSASNETNGTTSPTATVTVTATATATSKATDEPSPKPTKATKPTRKKQEPKSEPAARISKRQWAKIVKKPESYKGEKCIIYGQVTQFDSATGDDSFLADTAHRNTMSYDFFDGENTLLTGNAKQLDDLVEDDVFRASVTVLGKIDYDTQIGGNTTVPLLEVNSIKVIE